MIALIAGCQGTFPSGGGSDATRAASIGESVQLIERDVEAPEVFSTSESALWDGRPSLGGVWVASADVREPERVIIRNEQNGKFVIGALFKRERLGPGPALQLSSDAANALGILAGSPTSIDVVALRREESAAPTPAPAASAPVAVANTETAPLAEEIVQAAESPVAGSDATARPDAIAAAAAALDDVETGEITPGEDALQTASADAGLETPRVSAPERGNFFSRIFKRRAPATPAALPDQTIVPDAFDQTAAAGASAAVVTATSLDAAPVRTASASPEPVRSGGLDRAFVQIGIFSVEENARNTATSLSQAGIVPTVLEQESSGRKFWRVVVGPSTTASDRAAVIRKAKSMGFTDAFATRS